MDHPSADDAHPLLAALAAAGCALGRAAGECGAGRVWQLSAADTVAAVAAVMAVQAQTTAVLSALLTHAEDIDVKQELAATSTAWWLAAKQKISRATANEHLRVASAMQRQPAAAGLLVGGVASVEHAKSVARTLDAIDALGTVTVDERTRAVELLTEQAAALDPRELDIIGAQLVEALTVTPDVDDPVEAAAVERESAEPPAHRFFTLRRDRDGTWSGRFKGLDALAGAALDGFIHRVLHPVKHDNDPTDPGASQADPDGTDGRVDGSVNAHGSVDGADGPVGSVDVADPHVDEACRDTRPYGARRLDALAELVTVGAGHAALPGDKTGRAPLLLVTCDYDSVARELTSGQLEDGTPVAAADLRLLACTAGVLPAVMGGPSQPLDLGTTRRLFSPAQRAALALRDRGCTFGTCQRRATDCQAHHRDPWEQGGPTDLDNGCLLCPYHHALVHRQGWTSRINPADGHVEWRPPAAIDPEQRWRQHIRYRIAELFPRR